MANVDSDDNKASLLSDFNLNQDNRGPNIQDNRGPNISSVDASRTATAAAPIARQTSHLLNPSVNDAYDCDLGDGDNVARLTSGNHPPERCTDDGTTSLDDNVVAVFVVAFDTKAGNIIEWQIPQDINLDGIEFKAMASGSHKMKTDFLYFHKDKLFGLACFENMSVCNKSERGARMKSVGVLARSYATLYRHLPFLETQVRHLLETPGRYNQLKAFWEDKKCVLHPSDVQIDCITRSPSCSSATLSSTMMYPNHCFQMFFELFGNQMFILWKFALLRKRILFFSPPPISVICYRVYAACCMANHTKHKLLMTGGPIKPHFYVNIADIDDLESDMSYIACTTEKIFETKPRLYDLYVDNNKPTTTSDRLKSLLKVSSADVDKFNKLTVRRDQQQFLTEQAHGGGGGSPDFEQIFTAFFTEQNDRIFQTLIDLSSSEDRTLTADHMKSMGLDPVGDRPFLLELLETYGIDVMLIIDMPCCRELNLC